VNGLTPLLCGACVLIHPEPYVLPTQKSSCITLSFFFFQAFSVSIPSTWNSLNTHIPFLDKLSNVKHELTSTIPVWFYRLVTLFQRLWFVVTILALYKFVCMFACMYGDTSAGAKTRRVRRARGGKAEYAMHHCHVVLGLLLLMRLTLLFGQAPLYFAEDCCLVFDSTYRHSLRHTEQLWRQNFSSWLSFVELTSCPAAWSGRHL